MSERKPFLLRLDPRLHEALQKWSFVGGNPLWVLAYVAFVGAGLLVAFLVATARTLATFDRVET